VIAKVTAAAAASIETMAVNELMVFPLPLALPTEARFPGR
jgi:hypothetical protein